MPGTEKALCSATQNVAPAANFRHSGLCSVLYFCNFYLYIHAVVRSPGRGVVAECLGVSPCIWQVVCPLQTSTGVLASPRDIRSLPCCVLTVPHGCGEEHGE